MEEQIKVIEQAPIQQVVAEPVRETVYPEPKKRRGFFGKRKKINEVTKVISNADTIFREISFFHQEVIMLFAGTFLAFVLVMLKFVGYMDDALFYAVIVLAVMMWLPFMIKRMFFQPIGKKSIIIRFFQNGGVDIGVGAIKNKIMDFERSKTAQKIQITNIRRHWHTLTGRPVVALVEDYPENVSVLKDFKPTTESKDFSTLLADAAQTYYNLGRRDEARKQGSLNMTSILLIIALVVIGIVLLLVFQQTGILQEIAKNIPMAKPA